MDKTILTGKLVQDHDEFTLVELSRVCGRSEEWLLELVEEGVLEPKGVDRPHWRFEAASLRRVRIVHSLQMDLGVNLAGAALALELLDEVDRLRKQLTQHPF